ncbi:acetate/propionate family kinase [Thalassovita taeanensis]|uniref:Acetate kinase n=1 Tax=Thalassovita taeanensis TaxID=657014 RepID=A0A1H9FDF9_9RHOB|nr:acetate kinase [Thalassovita taeanensis]SEQ35954.1 acetate kinase [Thalassovita taeanensis]
MILVVNAGSSSIKVELFDLALAPVLSGAVSEIGGAARLKLGALRAEISAPDHVAALGHLLRALADQGHGLSQLSAAAHRIVHGGAALTAPARLTPDILDQVAGYVPLAPLHNPHNLSAIHALSKLAPDLPQYGSFDTAFHAANPEIATTYAIPAAERAKGIRRYGFHGLSYAGLVETLRPDLPRRLLALHLGNGASLCAILEGKSVATSMGYSPLDGLVMGTRAGAIDGMAVLRMAEDHGIKGAGDLLNKHSGLTAMGGTNDMAALLGTDTPEARFAVDHFCYWAARQAGSAIVAMGGVDAVAFTGGIGENAADIRERIVAHLAWIGPLPVHVIPADEELQIARDALHLIQSGA